VLQWAYVAGHLQCEYLFRDPLPLASCIYRKPINLNGKSVDYKSWLKSISFVVNTFPLCCGFENEHTRTGNPKKTSCNQASQPRNPSQNLLTKGEKCNKSRGEPSWVEKWSWLDDGLPSIQNENGTGSCCFTFFWHVHLQSHLPTLPNTHGTHSISKSTFKSRLVSSSSSFHWSWLDLTVLPVSQYICCELVVQRFRQLILLDHTDSCGRTGRICCDLYVW